METIEEFFRPEFAQNTQSLDDINDDSDNRSDDDNATDGGIVKMIPGLDGAGVNNPSNTSAMKKRSKKQSNNSKMKKMSASSNKMGGPK